MKSPYVKQILLSIQNHLLYYTTNHNRKPAGCPQKSPLGSFQTEDNCFIKDPTN